MSRTLALPALVFALAVAVGCNASYVAEEERQPAGLRLQPVPGAVADPDEAFRLPPTVHRDPLQDP